MLSDGRREHNVGVRSERMEKIKNWNKCNCTECKQVTSYESFVLNQTARIFKSSKVEIRCNNVNIHILTPAHVCLSLWLSTGT